MDVLEADEIVIQCITNTKEAPVYRGFLFGLRFGGTSEEAKAYMISEPEPS